MKVLRMLGCLFLLCGIICSCALLARASPTAAEELVSSEASAVIIKPTAPSDTVEISPIYSEGLRFRSNGDGTCALAGVGSCSSSLILVPPRSPAGDTVIEILPYALRDSIVTAIEIPTSVRVLSAASFAECPRLAYVHVAKGSSYYSESDGVLYNAEKTTAIYCPVARAESELRLPSNLCRINAGAFAACVGLRTVIFEGSTSRWQSITVGDENDALYAAAFKFES